MKVRCRNGCGRGALDSFGGARPNFDVALVEIGRRFKRQADFRSRATLMRGLKSLAEKFDSVLIRGHYRKFRG